MFPTVSIRKKKDIYAFICEVHRMRRSNILSPGLFLQVSIYISIFIAMD